MWRRVTPAQPEPKLENIDIGPLDIEGLAHFAEEQGCALTVIGPGGAIGCGIVDHFTNGASPALGPAREPRSWRAANPSPKTFWHDTTSHRVLRRVYRDRSRPRLRA
jgi:hypothetical protein